MSAVELMADDNLHEYVFGIFYKRFGPDVIEAAAGYLPHQARVWVKVRWFAPGMKEVARAIEEEFAELGQAVWVELRL